MATTKSVDAIVGVIVGAVLIFFLIANTFNDAGSELETVNESIKGGKLIKLLPLFLAAGLVFVMYRMTTGKM